MTPAVTGLLAISFVIYPIREGGALRKHDTCRPRVTISFRESTRLGDSIGPGALAERALGVLRNRRGELLVSQMMAADGRPYVFSSKGVFLRRVGRVGTRSPNLVAIMRMVLNAKDSLFAFDARHQQVLAAGGNYDTARAVPWDAFSPTLTDIVALPDGRFVASGEVKTRTAVG